MLYAGILGRGVHVHQAQTSARGPDGMGRAYEADGGQYHFVRCSQVKRRHRLEETFGTASDGDHLFAFGTHVVGERPLKGFHPRSGTGPPSGEDFGDRVQLVSPEARLEYADHLGGSPYKDNNSLVVSTTAVVSITISDSTMRCRASNHMRFSES